MRSFLLVLVLLTSFFVGCSTKNDNDYYTFAKSELDSENYESALQNFQIIVNEYPESQHYKEALLHTGELNHGLVNKKLSREESYLKAIEAYTLYQEKYPDDSKAPQTLFMVGFIQANELGKLDDAKTTYSKFIELYPDSEMVESAKSEIINIGLTPEEILKAKEVK
jgi:TolA-binding protein